MSEMIDLKRIEKHFEDANQHVENAEKKARATVIDIIEAGEELNNAKELVPHGEWAIWLGKHWNYTQQTATNYMNIANSKHALNLKEVGSIREALRMIADSKPETVPSSERKPADVVVSIPDETFEDSDCAEAIATCGKGDEREDDEPDDDPTPDPPTIRKTAKGSDKVDEDKKPKTAAIIPEILQDEPTPAVRTEEIINAFVIQCEVEQFLELKAKAGIVWNAKAEAKMLRKLADKLDPPTSISEETENDNETEKPRNPESCLGPNGRPRVQKVKFRYIQP